jgi:hypothetical protein
LHGQQCPDDHIGALRNPSATPIVTTDPGIADPDGLLRRRARSSERIRVFRLPFTILSMPTAECVPVTPRPASPP